MGIRDGLVTSTEAAKRLDVPIQTLYAWERKGLITPKIRYPGGRRHWDPAEVERFARSLEVAS